MTERSNLSSLLCAGRHSWSPAASPVPIGAVLGQSAPGTAYENGKVVCIEKPSPFRRVTLFTRGHWQPPELVARTLGCCCVSCVPFFFGCHHGWRSPAASRIPARYVRLSCDRCSRVGQYRKQNLVERFGSNIPLPELRHEIAKRERRGKMHDACAVGILI